MSDNAVIWEFEQRHGELSTDSIVNSIWRMGRAASVPVVCEDLIADPAQSLRTPGDLLGDK